MSHYNTYAERTAELSGLGVDSAVVSLPEARPEYSGLVEAMRARLREFGLTDDHGKLRALMAAEDALRDPEQAVQDWLEANGWPLSDDDELDWEEWDDYKRGKI